MNQFFWGALSVLCLVAAVFFGKYWKRTSDQLFAAFAAGFGVLGLHWALLGLINPSDETRHFLYVPRFLAFALILLGVIRKNRSAH
jgi:hypothetical protein